MNHNGPEQQAAQAMADGFSAYHARFADVTRCARQHFEQRDWASAVRDAAERLALHKRFAEATVAEVRVAMGPQARDPLCWPAIKDAFASIVADRADAELAETFFNSSSRRLFATSGVDGRIEFVRPMMLPRAASQSAEPPICRTFADRVLDAALVREMLSLFCWSVPFADLDGDAEAVAQVLAAELPGVRTGLRLTVDVLSAPFFRNKGAYVVGRLRWPSGEVSPLVLPLMHRDRGLVVDAVLLTESETSVVFGFSWSYFHVETPRPRALVSFLESIMPLKRLDELYTSIGYNKHGKTVLYRSLLEHMGRPDARFEKAEGDEGLVMAVFTLPSFNVVFKVIKDTFGQPKRTTRRTVMDKYTFVFVRDRVGRLADAQEFEGLEFRRDSFTPELLTWLLDVAASTVRVDGARVIFKHLYTERRVTPLNLFLRDAPFEAARDAVIDYGTAIKDLAGANIFTGDMLLKNFGVTRHGRLICYDYDELCLLSDCHIRTIPQALDPSDEMGAEPWFYVGENDVFPEEFDAFLVPSGALRDGFLAAHGDLLRAEYWRELQSRVRAGEMVDVFPYRERRRLRRD